jgi:hypothetical protein
MALPSTFFLLEVSTNIIVDFDGYISFENKIMNLQQRFSIFSSYFVMTSHSTVMDLVSTEEGKQAPLLYSNVVDT